MDEKRYDPSEAAEIMIYINNGDMLIYMLSFCVSSKATRRFVTWSYWTSTCPVFWIYFNALKSIALSPSNLIGSLLLFQLSLSTFDFDLTEGGFWLRSVGALEPLEAEKRNRSGLSADVHRGIAFHAGKSSSLCFPVLVRSVRHFGRAPAPSARSIRRLRRCLAGERLSRQTRLRPPGRLSVQRKATVGAPVAHLDNDGEDDLRTAEELQLRVHLPGTLALVCTVDGCQFDLPGAVPSVHLQLDSPGDEA